MPSVQDTTKSVTHGIMLFKRRIPLPSWHELPFNVYLLLFFTLGKGFQITISTLNITYYAHSLGYKPDFIGLLNAMGAIGSLMGAIPIGLLSDRVGRKPVLLISALLTPLFLAITGLMTTAPLLLGASLLQGVVASAYWVTNIPILTESTSERQRVGVLALNSFFAARCWGVGQSVGWRNTGICGGHPACFGGQHRAVTLGRADSGALHTGFWSAALVLTRTKAHTTNTTDKTCATDRRRSSAGDARYGYTFIAGAKEERQDSDSRETTCGALCAIAGA